MAVQLIDVAFMASLIGTRIDGAGPKLHRHPRSRSRGLHAAVASRSGWSRAAATAQPRNCLDPE